MSYSFISLRYLHITSPICSFVTVSSLDLLTALHQKSTSAASNIRFVISLIDYIPQLHVIIFFIMVLYIGLLLLLFVFLSKSVPFSGFFQRIRSNVSSLVISTPKYLYFMKHLISCPFSSVKLRCSPPTHMYSVL